jgi:hypothetical protein
MIGSNNGDMRFLRPILVHLCSLLVVMPMGWCCWLLPVAQAAVATRQAEPCKSCCRQHTEPSPDKPDQSPQRSSPCGCDERQAVSLIAKYVDAPLAALPVFVEIEPIRLIAGIAAHSTFVADLPPPPLQLLHCVWLC